MEGNQLTHQLMCAALRSAPPFTLSWLCPFNPQSSAPLQCFLQSLVLTLCSAELWSIPRFIGEAGKLPVSFWGLISLKAQQTRIQRLIEGDKRINESPWLSPSPHPSHRLQSTSRCRCLHSTLGNHCPTNHMGPQPDGYRWLQLIRNR